METYQGAPLAEYFKDREDPRIDRKKRYPLDELIVIMVLAFLSGAEGWEAIDDLAKCREPWLKK
ncbi:MAG: transposase family protein [Treponema sp.]|nr:transposase family protein [Treponema sp.]